MSVKIFLQGTKVSLTKINSRTKLLEEEKVFYSQVLDYDNSEMIELLVPIINDEFVSMESGDEYSLCFYTDLGFYQCRGRVITQYKKEKWNVLKLLLDSDIERLQKRKFYRLECFWDIVYSILENKETELDWEQGTTMDISGGGCRFNSRKELKTDTYILFKISSPTKKIWAGKSIEARVVSSKQLLNKPGIFENRIEFVHMSNLDREEIIRIIFEEERKIRQRERSYL